MRVQSVLAPLLVGLVGLVGPARASVDIRVNISTQTMTVTGSDGATQVWPVSTARHGFVTPRGTYRVQSLEAMHRSRKYNNAPMPHSMFFHGGYAIHGTYETAALGRAASHGCIRLSPAHAAELYGMVRQEGGQVTITGHDSDEPQTADMPRRHPARAPAYARRSGTPDPFVYTPLEPTFDDWTASDY